MLDGLLRHDHKEVGVALGQRQRIEAPLGGVGEQLRVVEEGELVGDGAEVRTAFLLAHLRLALDGDMRQPAGEALRAPDQLGELLPLALPHGEHAMDHAQGLELGRLAEAHPGDVSGDDGAGGLVEVPAVLGRARTGRRHQGVEQHVDVAHREALVLADERERVVGDAGHIRQVARVEILPVLPHHAEGIDQHGPPAHVAAAARGDAPELAARVDGDGGAVEAAALGREQVERDEGALSCARRGDGDGRALEGPADQGRVLPFTPLAEQDAPAPGQLAHGAPVQQRGPAVEVGLRAPAALAAAGLPEQMESRPAPEQCQHRDGRYREHQHDQPGPFQPKQPVQGGVGPLDLPEGAYDAGPERRDGNREARAVEPEADPASGALASARVVGCERRRSRERETGDGQVVRAGSRW